MSEDPGMARGDGEPTPAGEYGARRFADYLDWLRAEVVGGVLALAPEEQRTSRLPSGWTPVELLSHLLHMEQRWFVWGFLGEQVDRPWGDWDDADPEAPAARWSVPETVGADDLAERLADAGRRTRQILLTHPIHTPAALGGRFEADPPTLEWICFHVLAEYARHTGHLDIAAELARGRR